jgi:hypothetical protein
MNIMSNINRQIDIQLISVKNILTESLFKKLEALFIQFAEYATPVSAILGIAISFVIAIKTDSLSFFFGGGVAWIFILILFHYIGSKLQNSCQNTIDNNPSSVASQDYLDVISLVNLIGAIVSLIGGSYLAIKMSSFTPLMLSIGVSMVFVYTMWVTLNPRLVSTYVESSSSAGVDAIAVLILTNKIYLRANKIFFGLLPTLGAAILAKTLYQSFGDPFALLEGGIYGGIGFVLVLVGLISPFVSYLIFIFSYMLLDVLRSILSLGKAQGASPWHPVPQGDQGGNPTPNEVIEISGKTLLRVAVGALAIVLFVAIGIKGKVYYAEYMERAEIAQIEDDMKRANEERVALEKKWENERIADEKVRIDKFVAKARKHLNASSLDLLLEPDINNAFKEILRSSEDMQAFDGHFANTEKVIEFENLIIGQSCKDPCDIAKVVIFVDSQTGKVGGAVNTESGVMYYGIDAQSAPPFVKKWALKLTR